MFTEVKKGVGSGNFDNEREREFSPVFVGLGYENRKGKAGGYKNLVFS